MSQFDTRSTTAIVYGNSAPGMEQAALEEAREIFGPDVKLAVDRTYEIIKKAPITLIRYPEGKRLCANIRVQVMNELNPAYVEPPAERRSTHKLWPVQINITHIHKH